MIIKIIIGIVIFILGIIVGRKTHLSAQEKADLHYVKSIYY